MVYYHTLFQTSFPILVIRHSFCKKNFDCKKKKKAPKLQTTFWKSYLISYFLSISLSVSRNNLNWILILFFNLRIYQDCNRILIQLVLEAKCLRTQEAQSFFLIFFFVCFSWEQNDFLISPNNSPGLIDDETQFSNLYSRKPPGRTLCLGKEAALGLYFTPWPMRLPLTWEAFRGFTMNTIWLWRFEILTCLKCYVMTSWKILLSISVGRRLIARETFVLPLISFVETASLQLLALCHTPLCVCGGGWKRERMCVHVYVCICVSLFFFF